MGVFTHVSDDDARAILTAYDLRDLGDFRKIRGIPAGSVNSNYALELGTGGRVFLRVYEEQDAAGAHGEAALLAHLAKHGVKSAAPLARRDGGTLSVHAGKPAALFPWMQGGMRCQASVSEADAMRVGAELARVHVAGANGLDLEGVSEGRFKFEDLLVRIERIAKAEDPELAAQAAPLAEKLRMWMARREDLPKGLIHGDLFRDNVLWSEGGEVSALLDFESASRGVLAYDIMVTVIAWCFGDSFDTRLARAMLCGYRDVRELEEREKRGLLAEGCLASLRFTITRITDYAMKSGIGPRVIKDWRRFAMRLAALESLGETGLRDALGI